MWAIFRADGSRAGGNCGACDRGQDLSYYLCYCHDWLHTILCGIHAIDQSPIHSTLCGVML